MATYTGQDGSLSIDGTAVANVTSFSVEHTTNTVETTVMGQDSRTYVGGLREWTGSADVYYTEEGADDTASISGLLTGAEVAFIGYPAGDNASGGYGFPKLSGNVIITGISVNSETEGMVSASISFQGTGDLTVGVSAA